MMWRCGVAATRKSYILYVNLRGRARVVVLYILVCCVSVLCGVWGTRIWGVRVYNIIISLKRVCVLDNPRNGK